MKMHDSRELKKKDTDRGRPSFVLWDALATRSDVNELFSASRSNPRSVDVPGALRLSLMDRFWREKEVVDRS